MARWIDQYLEVNESARIVLRDRYVMIGAPNDSVATFKPLSLADAQAMSIALRMAAKRVEDIGKGLV